MNPADGSSPERLSEPLPEWQVVLPTWAPADPEHPTAEELEAYGAALERTRLDSIRAMEALAALTEARLRDPALPDDQKEALRQALLQAVDYLNVLRG